MAHGMTSGGFTKSPGWLDWSEEITSPEFRLPAGSVDSSTHVFGPGDRFPYAAERKYTPCDASAAELFDLHERLGIDRAVIVQATCHGTDPGALLDALRLGAGRARGVAAVRPDISSAELAEMHEAGVRGVRFNFIKRLVDRVPTDSLEAIVAKVAPLGWHVAISFEAADLAEYAEFFGRIEANLVIDHLGRPDVSKSADGPEYEQFLRFMREHPNVWTRVSGPERLSRSGPPALHGERHPYTDVVPFARRAIEEFPDRVLWGTDWPRPNLSDHMPDDGLLVDFIPSIARTPDEQHQLLVDNPTRLYWTEGA